MKIVITGICGFAGSHLAEHLLECGDEVVGFAPEGESRRHLSGIEDRLKILSVDVTDAAAVGRAVGDVHPEVICHLAGIASVGQAWHNMAETLRVNTAGLINMAMAGRETGRPRILVVGSGEMYGSVAPERQPIAEDEPLRPISPYALSKVWQESAAQFLATVYEYPLVITRPFNHTGPRQSRFFVCSDFAAQLAEIEAGRREPLIFVGNLEARRDFLDVRDMARAYRLAAVMGKNGRAYNLAAGAPVSIRRILDILISQCRAKVEVRLDPARLRPVDIPLLTGDSRLFRGDTGWAPAYSLERTLADLLDYWRGRIALGEN